MSELAKIETYGQFREALGTELRNQAEGFVRTGYLLKKARDTDILKESGYATVAEFAQAEYGLTKDIVSRYIAINDRYAKDGYSEYLEEKYEGYGIAKLQEMLTLPETVVDLMSPELTKREIQDIKKEIKEEEQITDIEVFLEGELPDQEHMTLMQKVIHKYFYEQKEQYIRLKDVIKGKRNHDAAVERILDVIAPSGIALKTVRVQGIGKLMISIKGKDNEIEMLNVRNNEKRSISWQQFVEDLKIVFGGKANTETWEFVYGEPFSESETVEKTKKSEVAPVQPVKTVSEHAEPDKREPEEVAEEVAEEKTEQESLEQEKTSEKEIATSEEPHDTLQQDIEMKAEENTETESAGNIEFESKEESEEEQPVFGQTSIVKKEGDEYREVREAVVEAVIKNVADRDIEEAAVIVADIVMEVISEHYRSISEVQKIVDAIRQGHKVRIAYYNPEEDETDDMVEKACW